MQALSPPNIESELSYAYLHAVASYASMACNVGNRHEDNNGIDATLTAWGFFMPIAPTDPTRLCESARVGAAQGSSQRPPLRHEPFPV